MADIKFLTKLFKGMQSLNAHLWNKQNYICWSVFLISTCWDFIASSSI